MADRHIHSGHRQRMKQRFLNYPPEFMYDHELFELALFYSRPVVNTNNCAHALLEKCGTVSGVLTSDISELEKTEGVGHGSAVFLKVLSEGVMRFLARGCEDMVLDTCDSIRSFFTEYFSGSDSELLCIAVVDAAMALVNTVCLPYKDVLHGSIGQRDLAELLIMRRAYRIVIGIFQPDGCGFPSPDNFAVTHAVSEISAAIGVELVDSVVCCKSSAYSMRSSGAFSFRR
ncbi:MAG TPA: JAB domain-containing protein [Ruminococcus flavefaciens]|nr:JAB domain-containing protein [Ruminococcus flavefaciens]